MRRVVVALAAAALTLWEFAGWTWWVLAVLVGGRSRHFAGRRGDHVS